MKKKISKIIITSMIMSNVSPVLNVYSSEVIKKNLSSIDKKLVNQSSINQFTLNNYQNFDEYNKKYKVQRDEIISIKTNGGQYSSSSIDKAIDDNLSTYWETGRQNSSNFINEVIVEFNDLKSINKIVYATRQDGAIGKGYPIKFDIYASQTENNDDFKLVSQGTSKSTGNLMEFKFDTVQAKKIKFVFKVADRDWASASEFWFYKEDKTSDKVDKLFTNRLMNELSEDFNTEEKLASLEEEVKNHPLKSLYEEDLALAKDLIKNPDKFKYSKIYTAEQRGRYTEETSMRSISGNAYSSFQSTGLYVTAGEEFEVYVEADINGVMPQLCLGQVGKDKGDWRRWVTLKPGRNIIKAPENINPSAVYIVNNANKNDQAFAPKIRLEGGTKFPTYIYGETDPREFAKEVKSYAEKVEYSDEAFANGNPEGKVYNIIELVSENCVITTTAKGAVKALDIMEKDNLTVEDTMREWEEMYYMFQHFQGFDIDVPSEKHSYFPNKFIARVFLGVPLGYADHGYTGYLGSNPTERDEGLFKQIVLPITHKNNDTWIYNHEFGHIFNTKYVVDGEVTNNLYAQEYRRIKGVGGDRSNWNEMMKRFKGENFAMNYFERLGVLSQINIAYGYDAYTKMSTYVRNNTEQIKSIKGSDKQRLAVAYSLALDVDLLDFFKGWNYIEVTEEMKDVVAHLPKPDKKIEYLYGAAYDYKGNGFNENLKVQVKSKVNEEERTNTLSFEIDSENRDDLLGYEILKDGKVIGYTINNNFVIKDIDLSENSSYDVVPYAKDLSTGKAVNIKAFSPNLDIQQESMIVNLRSDFNPADYVKGTTYKGEDISSNIKIESNVNTAEKGKYEVKYTLMDNDVKVEKVMNVEVVSSYDYLSDEDWESVETQWGTPRRNTNIKGRVNGEV
ncbi:M60 family metallopeptidase, partial [Clostridium perfringens]